MPRITQGNAKESLLATVTKFTEVTGEQVGLVFTWKGKIVVIGKEPFKELINEHRRDVQKSLFTFSSSAGSNHPHPTPTPPEVDNSGLVALLNSNIDPWSFSVERLRKLLNFAIKTSMGGMNYWTKKTCPRWWDRSIDFHNIKSGYRKETLISLLIRYINFESTNVISASPSPTRDRSPYSSTTCLLTRSQVDQTCLTASSSPRSSSPSISPPPFGFSDESKSPPPREYTHIIQPSIVSDSGIFQDVVESNQLGQLVEIYSDHSSSPNVSLSMASNMQGVDRDIIEVIDSVEPFFPLPKGVSSSISGDLELAAAISELSHNDVLLTDTTIHAFMVLACNQFPHLRGLQNIIEMYHIAFQPSSTQSIRIHHDVSRVHWLVSCADKEGKVSLFDSMFESVSDEVKLQLAEIYPQKYTFKYTMQQMQQQTGSEDCGVFAAAVYTALALGSNPSNIRWNQSQMRPHLLNA